MRKKQFVMIMLTMGLLAGCSNPQPAQTPETAQAIETELSTEVTTEEPTESVQQEMPTALSSVYSIDDAWDGTIGVSNIKISPWVTYGELTQLMTAKNYYVFWSSVDGISSGNAPELNTIPNEGTFDVIYALNGETDSSSPDLIQAKFGVKYDDTEISRQAADSRKNDDSTVITKYVLESLTAIISEDGRFTRSCITVPGYKSCLTTKEDVANAFGEDSVTADTSTHVTLMNGESDAIVQITMEFDAFGTAKSITVDYDVNGYHGKKVGVQAFSRARTQYPFIKNYVKQGMYFGMQDGKPYLFVANADTVDSDGKTYSVTVCVPDENNNIVELGTVSSDENYPIKISGDYLYCATDDMAVKILLDESELTMADSAEKVAVADDSESEESETSTESEEDSEAEASMESEESEESLETETIETEDSTEILEDDSSGEESTESDVADDNVNSAFNKLMNEYETAQELILFMRP